MTASRHLWIVHIDCDAFFASVTCREHPELDGQPLVIGGLGPRGVVATASYEAREFGIGSAMPMQQAQKLAAQVDQHIEFRTPDSEMYRTEARTIRRIIVDVAHHHAPDPQQVVLEPTSTDEAYLTLGSPTNLADISKFADDVRQQIQQQRQLTVSVGIGTTKLVAKCASEAAKPDGRLLIEPDDERQFLWDHPIGDIPGIGPATAERLHQLGVTSLLHLARINPTQLETTFGPSKARWLRHIAVNNDPRTVSRPEARKQLSAETTFDTDLTDHDDLRWHLADLAHTICRRVADSKRAARTITIKLRTSTFDTHTRSRSLPAATDDPTTFIDVATVLLDELHDELTTCDGRPPAVRLLGVGASNLQQPDQMTLPLASTDQARTAALQVGQQVGHPTFGRGTIQQIDGPVASVTFDQDGRTRDIDRSWLTPNNHN